MSLPAPLQRLWAIPFVRFLFVGGINTLFGYTVFAAFILLGFHYAVAALLSTVLGILFNFKTTGTIVFSSHDNTLILRFFGVYSLSYIIGVLVLRVFKSLGVHVLVTAAIMILPMASLAFVLNKALVFRPNRASKDGL